jgi:glycosyltransferase involved in cell wall biosynthesis
MHKREKGSVDNIDDLHPEVGSARERPHDIQREIVLVEPPGTQHSNITRFWPSDWVRILTPSERLRTVDNNYSHKEERLLYGKVKLVDFRDEQELLSLPVPEADVYRKRKTAVFRTFLEKRKGIPTLSIIIPVARGRREFLECLDSIRRQSFLKYQPQKVEILVIQDGEISKGKESPISTKVFDLIKQFPPIRRFRLYALSPILSASEGRSTARNVGVFFAKHEIVFFIDSSIVLEKNFLAEHMIRHRRIPGIALLGFKTNILPEDYRKRRNAIRKGQLRPDYRQDLKWKHTLKREEVEEGGFTYKDRRYQEGDEIRYLEVTDMLKSLEGDEWIGFRMTPTFFHTGITSVALDAVKGVGGFDPRYNSLWGYEDSFLGALLLAKKEIKFVPCPSSVAFKIEHPEDETKGSDLIANREQFLESLAKDDVDDFGPETLRDEIDGLIRRRALSKIIQRKRKWLAEVVTSLSS